MELHVRELFAGKWMEDKTVDVEDSLENGRSVGVVRVDLRGNLRDLRREIGQQIPKESDLPSQFAFVEKLGKQLVQIWDKEEALLRIKDLVGKEPEILIVEQIDQAKRQERSGSLAKRKSKVNKRGKNRSPTGPQGSMELDYTFNRRRRQGRTSLNRTRPDEELYSGDEKRRRKRTSSRRRQINEEDAYQSGRGRRSRGNRTGIGSEDEGKERSRRGRNTRQMSQSRIVPVERQWMESDAESSPRKPRVSQYRDLDGVLKAEIELQRPSTVRIRKERSLTEELRYREDSRPAVKNSIMKKSVSIDDVPNLAASDLEGFLSADSGPMDEYFLDREPFSLSALNLRDLQSRRTRSRKQFEPAKMERRISGLLKRIRDVQEKISLLKNIGQEHWRGRFFQLRRSTATLEARLSKLEDEEDDLQDNLMRLFELRKPLYRYGGPVTKKNMFILEAQKIKNEVNQLNAQLENIDLDLLKYRQMRKITENQNESLSNDIRREKFLRHLLMNRSIQP